MHFDKAKKKKNIFVLKTALFSIYKYWNKII